MSAERITKIGVLGLGLIGASFAAACKEYADDIFLVGYDTNQEACKEALQNGWVDALPKPGEALIDSLAGCDLVVLATPAQATLEHLDMLAQCGFEGIISDTASTKASICAHAAQVLPYKENFIPGHPMAGSEVNGIAGARPDLFEGCHWILCPDENTNAEQFSMLHDLLISIRARVLSLPREEHDAAVAVVSHVPHIMASSLVELAARHAGEQESLFRLAAGGFKDSTRIAAGSPELWSGISFDNKEALNSGLKEMQGIIAQFQDALEHDDKQAFTQLLQHSAQARRSLPSKWVPSTDKLLEVRIPMENRKGVVAEVTTIASKVGCNIQSIAIDHLTAHSAVLSMIFTDEGDVGKLSSELIKAGYTVSFSPLSAKE